MFTLKTSGVYSRKFFARQADGSAKSVWHRSTAPVVFPPGRGAIWDRHLWMLPGRFRAFAEVVSSAVDTIFSSLAAGSLPLR